MARRLALVDPALARLTHKNARTRVELVLRKRGNDRGIAVLRHVERHAAQTESTSPRGHMPQLGTNLLSHLEAVARVAQCADAGVVHEVNVRGAHLTVVLETARCQHNAVLGLDFLCSAGVVNLHAQNGLRLRILNKLGCGALKPDLDLAGIVVLEVGAYRLVKIRVAHAHVRRPKLGGNSTAELGILR